MNYTQQELLTTIPCLWIEGEWCTYIGKNNYHEFERGCGNKYYLTNEQFVNKLSDLIYQL